MNCKKVYGHRSKGNRCFPFRLLIEIATPCTPKESVVAGAGAGCIRFPPRLSDSLGGAGGAGTAGRFARVALVYFAYYLR